MPGEVWRCCETAYALGPRMLVLSFPPQGWRVSCKLRGKGTESMQLRPMEALADHALKST